MTERTSGPYSLLSSAAFYGAVQSLVGVRRYHERFLTDEVHPQPASRILDIGCGPGDVLEYLDDVDYVGFDISEKYIIAARQKYPKRGTFHVGCISEIPLDGKFDAIIAIGVLHHLTDAEVRQLFEHAARLLSPGGRLVTIDPTIVERQSRIARFLAKMDRGMHVRIPAALEELAQQQFSIVRTSVRHDLLRIPYTHVILTCENNCLPTVNHVGSRGGE